VTPPVEQIARTSGKGRQPAIVERCQDLADEVTALEQERETVATEMRALSARIQLAVHNDRPDVALHVAGRLDALGAALLRRGDRAA
jgi:hypothetical protein